MMSGKNLLKINIMHKKTNFELKVREEISIDDLKYQIERHENISLIYYYLFFDNLNLLDIYNSYTLKKIVEISKNISDKNKDIQDDDFIFYLINREEYKELIEKMNCLRCEMHSYNTSYLFCSDCELLICDQCRVTDHRSHVKVTDQALCLDAYFIKLQQYEKKFKILFGKSKVSDLSKICYDMELNLMDYAEKQKGEINSLADDMKRNIDRIRDLEVSRLDKFVVSGKNKIAEFEEEANLIFKLYNQCNEGLQARRTDLDAFSKWKNEQKVEYLKKIQKKNSEMIEKSSRIEKVLEKFQNVEEYDIYKLLESNKDFSYVITFTKLKQIFSKKLRKLESKFTSENCELLISKMENIKSKIGISKVYNRLLNLNDGGHKCEIILQPVDLTTTVNIFNISEKIISSQDVNFISGSGVVLNQFPKFSRSINIKNHLYVVGGEIDSAIVNYLIEVNFKTFEARVKKGMDYRRTAPTLVNISNVKMVVISGAYGESSCEMYNLEKNYWTSLSSVKEPRIGACALVYCSESIFLFFGKQWDSESRKWMFIESVERINLYEQFPTWQVLNFKSTSTGIIKNRAFPAIIACPNDKIFVIGGQFIHENKIDYATDILELDVENQTVSISNLAIPRRCCFIDQNFYFYNANAVNFDNEGAVLLYSVIFHEMWQLENY